MNIPAPAVFDLPAKFVHWRPGQWRAIEDALESERRFIVQCAPTGFGKSLAYMGVARAGSLRTVILTSTKGLQTQLMEDFREAGLVDVRGMNNYDCREVEVAVRPVRCDEGPCHAGYRCALRQGGCGYYDAVAVAKQSQLVVTNYAFWMTIGWLGEGLGDVDLLVLDEAHDAPDELASFLHVELEAAEVEGTLGTRFPDPGSDLETMRAWAAYHRDRAQERLDAIKAQMRAGIGPKSITYEARTLREIHRKLAFLAQAEGEWVVEQHERSQHWDPVWPGAYAERCLFRKTPKVMLVSATVRPKTLQLLGVRGRAGVDWDFEEFASGFPVERRPVIAVPTVRMNRFTDAGQMRTWLARIDQLIEARLDRKGIVHTVSYRRRNLVLQHSRWKDILISHDSRTTRHAVEVFKRTPPPAVMVSPSLGTGWDFPYQECEFQIIGKIPFPDTSGEAMKARVRTDPDYSSYIAAQNLVQMTGRGMRAEDDRCENLIIDDSISWFIPKYRHFFPKWFLDSITKVRTNPDPPEKL